MAQRIVIYWRDIPAQVIVRQGRTAEKRELPERFMQAIDRCAMKTGARDSSAYSDAFRRADPVACGDDLKAEADAAVAAIDRDYDDERLKALVANGGLNA